MENTHTYTYDIEQAKGLPMKTYRSWIRSLHGQPLKDYVVQTHPEAESLTVTGFQQGQGDNPLMGLTYRVVITRTAVDCTILENGVIYYHATPKSLRASLRRNGIEKKHVHADGGKESAQ
jgi:hypothetical protein